MDLVFLLDFRVWSPSSFDLVCLLDFKGLYGSRIAWTGYSRHFDAVLAMTHCFLRSPPKPTKSATRTSRTRFTNRSRRMRGSGSYKQFQIVAEEEEQHK